MFYIDRGRMFEAVVLRGLLSGSLGGSPEDSVRGAIVRSPMKKIPIEHGQKH